MMSRAAGADKDYSPPLRRGTYQASSSPAIHVFTQRSIQRRLIEARGPSPPPMTGPGQAAEVCRRDAPLVLRQAVQTASTCFSGIRPVGLRFMWAGAARVDNDTSPDAAATHRRRGLQWMPNRSPTTSRGPDGGRCKGVRIHEHGQLFPGRCLNFRSLTWRGTPEHGSMDVQMCPGQARQTAVTCSDWS